MEENKEESVRARIRSFMPEVLRAAVNIKFEGKSLIMTTELHKMIPSVGYTTLYHWRKGTKSISGSSHAKIVFELRKGVLFDLYMKHGLISELHVLAREIKKLNLVDKDN